MEKDSAYQAFRKLAIAEASRRHLEFPNHYAFVTGACVAMGYDEVLPREVYRADFNAGWDWADLVRD